MRYLIISFVLCFFVLHCSSSQQQVNVDETTPKSEKPADARWNEDFDPLSLGDSQIDVDSIQQTDDVVDIDQILRSSAMAEETERTQIPGFRVQLISTRNEEEARSIMRNAVISFNEPVYREYDNPYYKIRVGDFRSRYQASKIQEQAIEFGFHEAWVVRAMIWDRPLEAESEGDDEL